MLKIVLILLFFMIPTYSVQAQSTIVAITDHEIVAIDVEKDNAVIVLNEGDGFLTPSISPNKELVAYKDSQSNLYVTHLKNNYKTLIKIKGVIDYTWKDDTLIFSKGKGNVYQFDSKSKEVSLFLERTGYFYDELMISNQGVLYAKKYVMLKKDYLPVGIIEYDSVSLDESLLIAYEPVTKESIGFDPSIVNLSPDGNFIYVWCKGNQDTADGVTLGVYDTVNNELKQFNDFMLLSYADNVAISQTSNELIGVVSGDGRFMNENKHLKLLNVETKEVEPVTANDMVAMTPSFSQHGSKLFYSAGKEIEGDYKPFASGVNHIYVYDLYTKLSTQLTEGSTNFDFYPQEIEDNGLVFLRFEKDKKLNLIRRDNLGKEVIILEDLKSSGGYYGHVPGDEILAVKY